MLRDFEDPAAPSLVETDICVIGAGAAGIAVASTLTDKRLRVLLVESGGLRNEKAVEQLSGGISSGLPFTGLQAGRKRGFGGTTRLWYGQCIRLAPIDFERRAWVDYSGWPVREEELRRFYARAESFLNLDSPQYEEEEASTGGRFDERAVHIVRTVYCREPDFAKAHLRRLARQPNLDILIHSTTTSLLLDPASGHAIEAKIASVGGRRGSIRAKAFVLAGGAIENARLLLASRDVAARGIGNDNDLVGRFFQDHPTMGTARIHSPSLLKLQRRFRKIQHRRHRHFPKIALSAEAQRRFKVLNAVAYPVFGYGLPDRLRALGPRLFGDEASEKRRSVEPRGPRITAKDLIDSCVQAIRGRHGLLYPARVAHLRCFTEQRPTRGNRVSLSDALDVLGVPKPRVDWSLHDDERRTLQTLTKLIGEEFSRLNLGTVEPDAALDQEVAALRAHVNDTFHHAGTTRMAHTASEGVVDANCRVFSAANVFVTGGSVMPTSGYANPTLTIIALAIRLADRLRTQYAAQ